MAKYNHLLLVSTVLRFQSYQRRKKKLKFLDGSWLFIHKYLSTVVDFFFFFFFFKPYPHNRTQNISRELAMSCHPYLRPVFCITKSRMWLSTKLTQCVITISTTMHVFGNETTKALGIWLRGKNEDIDWPFNALTKTSYFKVKFVWIN